VRSFWWLNERNRSSIDGDIGACLFLYFFFCFVFFFLKNYRWVGFGVAQRVNEWQWLGGSKINRKRSSVR
jgi:hypothetical protein